MMLGEFDKNLEEELDHMTDYLLIIMWRKGLNWNFFNVKQLKKHTSTSDTNKYIALN